MKQNLIKIICGLYGLLILTLTACSTDDFRTTGEFTPQEDGLYLSLLLNGETKPSIVSRSNSIDGVDGLNENLIKTIDVFVFKGDESLNPNGYIHADVIDSNQPVSIYKGADWIDNFTDGQTYTMYAVANYRGDFDFNAVNNIEDLKSAIAKDADVVKWKGMKNYPELDKIFLMDGKRTFTRADLGDGSKAVELPVSVKRAAAKVELTLKLSEEMKAKFEMNNFKLQVVNYATRSAVLSDGYEPEDRGFATFPEGGYKDDLLVSYNAKGESVARFYTYVNNWKGSAQNETMLLIDLPGSYSEADGKVELYEHNYYKVPIIRADKDQILQRNTFYQVTATVDMLGSEEIDIPLELNNVQFTIANWEKNSVDVGSGEEPEYLVLSENVIDIRNVDEYNELEFYSSSPIKSVEFVGFANAQAAKTAGVQFDYPGEGTEIPAIYFVNSMNQRQRVDVNDPNDEGNNDKISVTCDGGTDGKIHLISPNPLNVTKRYITLKVTNEDDISKYVVIEQYPLEYIQPINGYYSYRDDFLSPLEASPAKVPIHWDQAYSSNLQVKQTEKRLGGYKYEKVSGNISLPTRNDYFYSKVYIKEDKNIYSYSFDTNTWPDYEKDEGWIWGEWQGNYWENQYRYGNYSNYPFTAEHSSWEEDNTNPMMYFVTITQTDEDYKIAHPLTEKAQEWDNQLVAVNSAENDGFVSPTFMLASQLGTVYSNYISGWEEARKHCAYYVETYKNKNDETIILDDWRLPTSAEIEVIIKYQNDPKTSDVMATVLGGANYYVAYSQANGDGTAAVPGGDNGKFIRCIRDVKPTDEFMQSK